MVCPHCGTDTPHPATVCLACHTPLPAIPSIRPDSETIGYTTGDPRVPGTAGPAALVPGAGFGPRYRILRRLGAGGMGVVYQAWDSELAVAVALKVIRPDVMAADSALAQEVERRFKRELLLARQVTHKNVVRIHDLGEVDGIKYITMPYIEGRDLATVLREHGRLPVPEALKIARQVAAGLVAAHEAGVVHRDLKPENMMIDADGHALIMDFGISRSVTAATATATAAGAIVGTLEYMAPEQARGAAVDQRADLYSLGLIVHDMIASRRRLTSSDSASSEMRRRMQTPPPALRTIVPEVPEAFERIVTKCLEPDPDQRYANSSALLDDLQALSPDGHAGAPRTSRRDSQWKAATAALLVLVLLSVGMAVWFAKKAPPAVTPARSPVSLLIADFRNDTGDPVFESTLEQALSIAVEGAPFIASFPRLDAQRAIERQRPGAKLDEEGARLLAAREGIGVILLGAITGAPASGYELSVRAVDPRADKVIAAKTVRAPDKGKVLEAVGELAAGLRRDLGDSPPEDAARAYSETFTAGSLEAMREYSVAQQLALNRRDDEAIPHYQAAVAKDASFGRAYAGWAVSAFTIGRRAEAEEQWKKALSLIGGMTERERYRTIGGYHLGVSRNYPQAIEQFSELVRKYPADTAGHSNLALAHFYMLEFPPAFEEGRKAMTLQPGSYRFASNYALYAMYAGEFAAAAQQSIDLIRQSPDRDVAYLPLAIAQIAAGKPDEARKTYERMAALPPGASVAAMGLADLAMWQGRYADAIAILKPAAERDVAAKNTAGVTSKFLALGEAQAVLGDRPGALASVRRAMASGDQEDVLLPAARILASIGRESDAKQLAGRLGAAIPVRTRAYGKIVEGELALRMGRARDAIDAFDAARKLSDVWLTHFDLGVAYVEAGRFVDAISELDRAQKRRGEATALFLDDIPTYRMLAPLAYWQGRANEGVGSASAAHDGYNAYLAIRGSAPGDPLAADARRRLQQPGR
jgi:tetratricopeptide (TPR) repeat protein/tRNA A-37 threonylcarbamoyl transferase component Bud32